jgi:hypothetical protein
VLQALSLQVLSLLALAVLLLMSQELQQEAQ